MAVPWFSFALNRVMSVSLALRYTPFRSKNRSIYTVDLPRIDMHLYGN